MSRPVYWTIIPYAELRRCSRRFQVAVPRFVRVVDEWYTQGLAARSTRKDGT